MKKKILIIVIFLVILCLLFVPIKFSYKDGGTVEYRALMYRVIKWRKWLGIEEIKTETKVIWFPNNFHSLDYYDEARPPQIALYDVKEDSLIAANTGSYCWSKIVEGDTLATCGDTIDALSMNYKKVVKSNVNSKIKVYNLANVKSIKVYDLDGNIVNELKYDKEDELILLEGLEPNTYIIQIDIRDGSNSAWYSFKLEII